jgi:hypothetical protein
MSILNSQRLQLRQLTRSKVRSLAELTKPQTAWYLQPRKETSCSNTYWQSMVSRCPTCGQTLSNAALQTQAYPTRYANSSGLGLWQAQAQYQNTGGCFAQQAQMAIFGDLSNSLALGALGETLAGCFNPKI